MARSTASSSSALSLSALMNDMAASSVVDNLLPLHSPLKHPQRDVVSDACMDVARELDAVEARLELYRRARHSQNDQSAALTQMAAHHAKNASVSKSLASSPHEQQAGQVANEVESALRNCDLLLERARASVASSRVSTSAHASMHKLLQSEARPESPVTSVAGASEREQTMSESHTRAATTPPRSTFVPVKAADSPLSSRETPAYPADPMRSALDAMSPEERELASRAAAIKAFAAKCQQEMQAEASAAQQQQHALQSGFLRELQRKYESKKKMSVLALKESYERETKALVRDMMDKYEREQAQVLAKLEDELVRERDRALDDVVAKHEQALEERVKRLEARLAAETLAKRRALESQLQTELEQRLQAIETDNDTAMRAYETQKRQELERELFQRRELAATEILRLQETRTSAMKCELELQHAANEATELEKLTKALAFGAQAQVQQLRAKLERDHDERVRETRADAAQSLELKRQELRVVLERTHSDSLQQLERELAKTHRIALIELQEQLQLTHDAKVQATRARADAEREQALAAVRREAADAHQRQLDDFERTLETELRVSVNQAEIELDASYAQSLDAQCEQLMEQHERELAARIARMEQAKSVLLAEAKAFLTLESSRGPDTPRDTSEASSRLSELKRQLSSELATYVEVLVTDVDDMTEEQRILVRKITELTQLYLGLKRQCATLETQSSELKSALRTLHTQLQTKDLMCKKLYEANEALLQRLQAPAPARAEMASRH